MSQLRTLKPYFQFGARTLSAARLFCVTVAFFTLCRFAFYLLFYGKAENFSHSEVTHAFLLGLRFDTRIALLLILPLLIFSFVKNWMWSRHNQALKIWVRCYTVLYAVVLFIFGADIGYYAYLESRISFRILEFAKNPLISLQMVWQTYNIIFWLLVLAGIVYSVSLLFRRYIFATQGLEINHPKKIKFTQSFTLSLLIVFGIHNSLSQYPLRWSDTFFTQNIFIASLAMNPIHYLVDTAENSRREYDLNKTQAHYKTTADYLGVKEQDEKSLQFLRPVELTTQFQGQPNIVYIVMESMTAYKTGVFGNPADPSPALDELAKNGWLFRNFYVPTEGTARSMFCILAGIPDINAKSTSSRNPHIVDQHTLINGFKNYEKYYFIGGNASWGNIRGVYMNNVKGLNFYEGDHLEGPRADVWGLSDLHLFREAARLLKSNYEQKNKKPFFALIQAASYHRPYTIPDDRGDFKERKLTPAELTQFGFASNEEYNSFRFSDYSLGEFMRLARESDFFKNTIFIVHGDHGLPHHSAAHLTDGYKHFGLNRFHTPLVFYSPLIDKSQEHNLIMTEPDVLPTILGLTGHPYQTRALGRNVFAESSANRYAFSYVYYSSPLQIMLYDQSHLLFGTEEKIISLHEYNLPTFKDDVKDKYPEKFKEMSDLLQGIFETSRYLLHHNPKIKSAE